jgi:NADPH:quinone reductase-like Zn-dependent oxidoreductase
VPVPQLSDGDVLIKVLACGVNNTDINTRLGWYGENGWQGSSIFPLIQGPDCCGTVVAIGKGVANGPDIMGKRVLVRPCQRTHGFESYESEWMASDFNGAFAEYVKVRSSEVFVISSDWTDAQLGSIPCSYGTAENMIHRSKLGNGETILVTGASGGVGSAVVQLAKRRGAIVIAVSTPEKMPCLLDTLHCDQVLARDDNLIAKLGSNSVDVVFDNVGGPGFPVLLKLLRPGGRYFSSGAVGGPGCNSMCGTCT